VEIQYAGIDLSSVAWLRYQYRMEGVDADWSNPSMETTVKYANIPSGSRRFDVRAVNYDGTVSPSIASVVMNIKAPLWQRAWFLALAALTLGALVYALYRYRVGHLLAVERIRTGIATDLHDDIGASLTQISLLSEVGRRDTTREVLGDIASISRELVQDMSDIVWAVSPRHDRFDAIVHRMRHFSEGAMPDGEVFFDTLQLPSSLPLPLEYRRPLYLIFKESVTNVVRHSGATRLTVRMSVKDGLLYLEIEDNGRGFDTDVFARGEGLGSIRRRILGLGGAVRWDSAPGNGTRLTVSLPLRSRTALPVLGGTRRLLRWLR
jgi:signal transduction histidine kinase